VARIVEMNERDLGYDPEERACGPNDWKQEVLVARH